MHVPAQLILTCEAHPGLATNLNGLRMKVPRDHLSMPTAGPLDHKVLKLKAITSSPSRPERPERPQDPRKMGDCKDPDTRAFPMSYLHESSTLVDSFYEGISLALSGHLHGHGAFSCKLHIQMIGDPFKPLTVSGGLHRESHISSILFSRFTICYFGPRG